MMWGNYTITPKGLSSENYNITFVPGTLTVTQAEPTFTYSPSIDATYGQTLADVSLTVISGNGTLSWAEDTGTRVGAVGMQNHKAIFTPNDAKNYKTITGIEIIVAAAKAEPAYTAPSGLIATYGDTLEKVTLPDGWSWKASTDTSVGNVGSNDFTAVFTPADTENYKTVETTLTITVEPKKVTVIGVAAANREYNGEKTVTLSGGSIVGAVDNDDVKVDLTGAQAVMADANASEKKAVTVAGVKLSGDAASNYELTSQPTDVTVTISKAQATPVSRTIQVTNDLAETYSFNLADLLPALDGGKSFGNVSYTLGEVNFTAAGYYNDNAAIDGSTLTLPIAAVNSNTQAQIGTITVAIES